MDSDGLHKKSDLSLGSQVRSPSTAKHTSPHHLTDLLVVIQCRTRQQALTAPPDMKLELPMVSLIPSIYEGIPTDRILVNHLSFDLLVGWIEKESKIKFDNALHEMGWLQGPQAGMKEQHVRISTEITFRNAIGVMQLQTKKSEVPQITLYLWAPALTEHFFRLPGWDTKATTCVTATSSPPAEEDIYGCSPPPGEAAPVATPVSLTELNVEASLSADSDSEPIHGAGSSRSLAHQEASGHSHISNGGPTVEDSGGPHGSTPPDTSTKAEALVHLPARKSSSAEPAETMLSLDMSKLFAQCSDDIYKAREQQPGETDEEFTIRQEEEDELLREMETQKLQARLESKVCEQLDEEKWRLTCQLLHHPEGKMSSDSRVRIPGFSRLLLPCQAHCVVRTLLAHNSALGSCFHGHAMGLGKTTIAIATQHIQHIVNLMRSHIHDNPGRHVLVDDAEGNMTCSINHEMVNKYGFDCPCFPSSPTHGIQEKLGICVVLAPLGLLRNWCGEWAKCYAGDNPLKMVLVLCHANAKATEGYKMSDETSRLMEGDAIEQGEDQCPLVDPQLKNGRVICVTTSQSFKSHVEGHFSRVKKYTWQPQGVEKVKKSGEKYLSTPHLKTKQLPYVCLVVASVWRDEAHLERLATSKTIQLLRGSFFTSEQNRGIYFNIMSGTLLTTGPTDIAQYIDIMARDRGSWAYHAELRKWRKSEATKLGAEWDALVKRGGVQDQDSQRIINRFKPLIESLVLRFTPSSNFLGTGLVVELPPNHYAEVKCEHSKDWNDRLQQLKQEEDLRYAKKESRRKAEHMAKHHGMQNYIPLRRDGATLHYRERLCASVPGLMDIQAGKLKLTEAEWSERRKAREWMGDDEPYRKHIQMLANSSGKLKMIGQKIDEFNHFEDGEGLPTRLIFCSYFFTGARIIYLFMVHVLHIPEADILFLHKLLSQREIDSGLAKFHGVSTMNHQRPRYIVATTSAFGVGLTLSEVLGIGLLEPDYRVATELQVFSRHNRLGNKNKETFSWLFYAANNARENKIRTTNHIRKRIEETLEGKIQHIQ